MSKPTPVQNELHTAETIDTVLPRLQRFVGELIESLQALNQDVHTSTTYLLGSSQHPIEVISQVNTTHIKMEFTASAPGWAEGARARLDVTFNRGKSKKFYERKDKTFDLVKVVKTFILGVSVGDAKFSETQEEERKARMAESAFQELAQSLGVAINPLDPHVLKMDNCRIHALPAKPTKVAVAVTVTHEQAIELIAKYRRSRDKSKE